MISRVLTLITCLLCFPVFGIAQDPYCDSLLKILPGLEEDSNKAMTLYRLCSCYYFDDTQTAVGYGKQALALSEKIKFKKGIAASANNLGIAYDNMGEYDKAAQLYYRSIKIKEELGNLRGLASSYGNLGGIFDAQGNLEKAEEYHLKALAIGEKLHDTSIIAYAHQNLGILEMQWKKEGPALMHFQHAVSMFHLLGDSLNYANNLNNIGVVLFNAKKYETVEYYYRKAFDIRMRANDRLDLINSYNNLAGLLVVRGKFSEGKENYLKSLAIGVEIGALPYLRSTYAGLAEVCDSLQDYKNAYYYQGLYRKLNDSIANMNTKKELAVLEYKYLQEKKDKEDAILEAAEAKQRILIFVFLLILLVVITSFSIFLFNRFRVIRRQKAVIEQKSKEIVDSMNYAQRIQQSILPTERYIEKTLHKLNK